MVALRVNASPLPDIYSRGFWVISETPETVTWVEIFNTPESAAQTGLAHVAVLSKRKSDPVWEFKWVCDHIAITTDALKRSVIRPYKIKGGAYPAEHFDPAYASWSAEEKEGKAPICSTSIADFLKMQH